MEREDDPAGAEFFCGLLIAVAIPTVVRVYMPQSTLLAFALCAALAVCAQLGLTREAPRPVSRWLPPARVV